MSLVRTPLAPWLPVTPEDRAAVLAELDGVVASPHFCNSKRYPALLRFIVETTLAGHADQLKERTIGVEVFHRPPDYDTNADTVVRYTAGEVRKRLSLYYHDYEAQDGQQISLPVGSYVPEFLREKPPAALGPGETTDALGGTRASPFEVRLSMGEPVLAPASGYPARLADTVAPARSGLRAALWIPVVLTTLLLAAVYGWSVARHPATALDAFWAPLLHEQGKTLLCPGGVVFAPNNFSGVQTAGKDNEYPFVSMQIAASIADISGLLQRGGAMYQMEAASSTPLSALRDRPVVLLGGYNNQWTVRLMAPLRFHFAQNTDEQIVDGSTPGRVWRRDQSRGYASADDYALIARFRDTTTGSMIIVVAGLGRNGTEVASQFVTSEHYLRLLDERLGHAAGTANVEAVLKTSVIDGKTGAPSIEAWHTW